MDFVQNIGGVNFVNGKPAIPPNQYLVFDDKSSQNIDLKDFFTFFKFKIDNYDQFSFDVTDKLQKKQFSEGRLQTILHSFVNVDGAEDFPPLELIPFHVFENFASVSHDFYHTCWLDFQKKPIFQDFYDFYTENIVAFHVSEKISGTYPFGSTQFEFAENFRFKSKKNTLDLFHLGKEGREIVSCGEDYFVYAPDYKQFEFRTFLNLIGYDSSIFSESIYDFLGEKMKMAPDKAKISTISWLYSPYPNDRLDQEMDKNILLNKIVDGCGHFNYPVYVGENSLPHKRVHTIVQTVSQFVYIQKLHRVLSVLQDRLSKFIFPLHDCMIFFIHKSELDVVDKIDEIMEDDVYKTKKYIGKNYRDIKEI